MSSYTAKIYKRQKTLKKTRHTKLTDQLPFRSIFRRGMIIQEVRSESTAWNTTRWTICKSWKTAAN